MVSTITNPILILTQVKIHRTSVNVIFPGGKELYFCVIFCYDDYVGCQEKQLGKKYNCLFNLNRYTDYISFNIISVGQ